MIQLQIGSEKCYHILFEMLSSDFRPDYRNCRDLRYMSLVKQFKIAVIAVRKMWFAQDTKNSTDRIETFCSNNPPGLRY